MRRHAVDTAMPPAEALAAVADAAERWGALWHPGIDGGTLELPVTAGLRHGRVRGRLSVRSVAGGSRLELAVEDTSWTLRAPALVVLTVGAAGGLYGLAAPFLWAFWPHHFEGSVQLVPLAAFLAFTAWFLVVSRLRTSGPQEFLETVVLAGEEAADPPDRT